MSEHEERVGLVVVPDGKANPQQVPLTAVSIESRITGPLAEVAVTQTYANREEKPVEAMFVFPLPTRAVVRSFAATIGDRRIVGTIADREEAFDKYDEAIAEGHGAFLLDQERPNIFTTSVGNLEPGRDVSIEITYVTELPRDADELRLQIPMTIAPRYTPHDHHTPAGREDAERVSPPIAKGDPGYTLDLTVRADLLAPIASIESPTHRLLTEVDGTRATIGLAENDRSLDRDFALLLRTRERVETEPRIETDTNGDRFILTSFRPEIVTQRVPVELVFVVDCSGSMAGTSIAEARRTLRKGIDQLQAGDRFGVILFGSHYESLFGLGWRDRMARFGRGESVDREQVFQTLPLSDQNLCLARRKIEEIDANLGGTELLEPLEVVLSAPATEGFARRVVVITDGEVTNEEQVITSVRDRAGDARVFTFGVGAGASEHLVRGIADAGRGAAEMVVPGERIDRIVMRHFTRITEGCFDSGRVEFEGIEVEDVTPRQVPPLAAGEEFLVLAKVRSGTAGRAILRGTVSGNPVESLVEIPESASVPAADGAGLLPISWARRLIAELELDASGDRLGRRARRGSARTDRSRSRTKKRIREVALAHALVSSETSFVAIEEREEGEKTIERAVLRRVPVPLTRGWGGGLMARSALRCGSSLDELSCSAGISSFRAGSLETPARASKAPDKNLLEAAGGKPNQRSASKRSEGLLALRNSDGSWSWSDELAKLLGIEIEERAAFLEAVRKSRHPLELVLTILVESILIPELGWIGPGARPESKSTRTWLEENVPSEGLPELSDWILELRDRYIIASRP